MLLAAEKPLLDPQHIEIAAEKAVGGVRPLMDRDSAFEPGRPFLIGERPQLHIATAMLIGDRRIQSSSSMVSLK